MLVISDIVAHEGVEWLLSELRENPYEIALGHYLGAEDQATRCPPTSSPSKMEPHLQSIRKS